MLLGQRVMLRLVEEQDLDLIAQWRNDPEIRPYFFAAFPIVISGQRKWFEKMLDNERKKLFVIQKKEGQAVGTIGLDDIDWKNQVAEYGNLLIGVKEERGKGLAQDATLTLLHFAFKELNLNRVFLRVFAFNVAAIALYEKCGFRQEGILRQAHFTQGRFVDIAVMAILREEFQL